MPAGPAASSNRLRRRFRLRPRRASPHTAHSFTIGPIVTYDTKLGGKAPLSFSLRWVPTVTSKNRLDSTATVLATATLVF